MTDATIPHPTEVGPEYAVARAFLAHERTVRFTSHRPRSDDYRHAIGATEALSELAADLGFTAYRGTIRVLTRETIEARPMEAGPAWLHAAALDLVERMARRLAR